MWPDRVSNPGPPTYESGALPIALRGPANKYISIFSHKVIKHFTVDLLNELIKLMML